MCWNRLDKLRFVKAALGTFTWSKFHFLRVTKAQGGTRCTHNRGRGFDVFFGLKIYTLEIFFLDKRSVIYFLSTSTLPPKSKASQKGVRCSPFLFFWAVLGGKLIYAFLHSKLKVDNKLRWKILGANVLNAVRERSMYNPPFFLCSSH